MPQRVTWTRSRRSLWGGRVRVTRSHLESTKEERDAERAARKAEQVAHGVTVLQGRRAQREIAMTAARQRDREAHAAAFHSPRRVVTWLHTPLGIGVLAAAIVAVWVAATASEHFAALWYVPTLALLVADWHNMVTLHGWIRWRTLWTRSKALTMLVGVSVGALFMLPPVVYAIQAGATMKAMRAARQAQMQATIERLERDLGYHAEDAE